MGEQKQGEKNQQKCSFCGELGHKRTTCLNRQRQKVAKLRAELHSAEALLAAVEKKQKALLQLDTVADSDDSFDVVDAPKKSS